MRTATYTPSPPLNAYIHDLYYFDGPAAYARQKVLPAPSVQLMVNLGAPFQVFAADQTAPFTACGESWCIGMWDTFHIVDWPPAVRFFGVHFKPGGAYPFLRLPLSELHNQVVALEALWGCAAGELREQLYAAPSVQAGFALLERRLLARLCEAPQSLALVQYAITEIARQRGALSVRALSEQIGISQNHLGTHFKRMVGTTPKALARLYRFEHILDSIDPAQPVDWSEMAMRACYYDQAHFNKDFAALTGYSPTGYLRQRRQTEAENPEHTRLLRNLPID